MEGFVNQVKKYFKQTESLIKELYKNLINSGEGEIYITPFYVSSTGEVLKITGKGVIKNIVLATSQNATLVGFTIKVDGKNKIKVPTISNETYVFPKYNDNGYTGCLVLNENIKFNDSVVMTVDNRNGRPYGHIMYTLDD